MIKGHKKKIYRRKNSIGKLTYEKKTLNLTSNQRIQFFSNTSLLPIRWTKVFTCLLMSSVGQHIRRHALMHCW